MSLRETLAQSELFRGTSEEERDLVIALGRPCSFEDGQVIVREDDEAQELYLFAEGRGEVEIKWPFGEGGQHMIGQVKRGDLIGEVTLVDRCLRSATVKALGRVEALVIPNQALRKLLEERPPLGYRVMENVARLLARRIRETNLKLRNTIANLIY
jgi:CRP-like cAMP-binding protein